MAHERLQDAVDYGNFNNQQGITILGALLSVRPELEQFRANVQNAYQNGVIANIPFLGPEYEEFTDYYLVQKMRDIRRRFLFH
jgi:hypothetical protein